MANVKISNLPVETTLANMTGIAGYNAAGTAQISGANIISGAAQPDQNLASVLATGSIATSGQTITLANSASNTSTTMGVNAISSDTSFSIIGTTNNTNLTLTSGGELRITPNASLGTPNIGYVLTAKNAQGDLQWSQFAIAQGIINVLSSGSTANPGQSITFSGAGGATNTFGLTGSSANNSNEVKATGGNVEINSVSNDVVITGGGNLVLQNTGLGTPVSGDYLVADGVTGKAIWETDPKAFVTLTGSPTWVIRDGYNATWNIGAGSETLTITANDGDTGTLIVTTTTGEITWPTGSLWVGGTEPTLTNGVDVFSFIYDGTNYYWSYGQDFS